MVYYGSKPCPVAFLFRSENRWPLFVPACFSQPSPPIHVVPAKQVIFKMFDEKWLLQMFDVLILPFSALNIQLHVLFYTHMYTTGGGYVEANYMHNNISIICTQAWLL